MISWPPRDQGCNPATHEPETRGLLEQEIRPDDVFWDVGAHVGILSRVVREAQPRARIIAIEACPWTFTRLAQEFRDDPGIDLVLAAGWSAPGLLELSLARADMMTMVGPNLHERLPGNECPIRAGRSLRVPAITLDGLVAAGLPSPNVLKIDCEGSDLQVLRGAEGILQSPSFRLLLVEVNNPLLRLQGTTAIDLEAFVRSRGFVSGLEKLDTMNECWRRA